MVSASSIRRRVLGVVAAVSVAAVWGSAGSGPDDVTVIVRAANGDTGGARRLMEQLGGEIDRDVALLEGFIGSLPSDRLDDLAAHDSVASVTVDVAVRLATSDTYDPSADVNSLMSTGEAIKARHVWSKGPAGDGIGVAVIDTGVTRVRGLDAPGKVIYGPDLTPEALDPALADLDGYGHGTFMAGLIAGNDLGVPVTKANAKNTSDYLGIAPNATVISIKVGDRLGTTVVGSVILALDWVVEHAHDPAMNIRVVNLSFSTDSTQTYLLDPLAFAVERVWQHGIVVVTAAGNAGTSAGRMTMPAADPFVIAVGANHTMGTTKTDDDEIPTFSSRGDGSRNPDLVAPGVSMQGLRVPGSHADTTFGPTSAFGGRYIRGSGTSQAAAIASGAVAILLSRNPAMTPDEVKAVLMQTAKELSDADPQAQGAGLIDLEKAVKVKDPTKLVQRYWDSWGSGSLEAAGGTWTGPTWTGNRWSGNRWSEATWTGNRWSGAIWSAP